MKKLKSLSIFFPFYNDAGTVEKAITLAYKIGQRIAQKLEVIAIHGGQSKDNTFGEIKRMKKRYPSLIIVDKTNNWESYAVIKYGFQKANSDFVFYTDGDLQYDLKELEKLVEIQLKKNADVVNGYKRGRGDSLPRVLFGYAYKSLARIFFKLPIRDLTCDFRLIRKSFLKKINLESHDASILLELIKKLEKARAKFVDVPVNHYPRTYGKSAYNLFKLLEERVIGDIKVWIKLKKKTV